MIKNYKNSASRMKSITEPAWCVCVGGWGLERTKKVNRVGNLGNLENVETPSRVASVDTKGKEACEATEVRLLSKEWL